MRKSSWKTMVLLLGSSLAAEMAAAQVVAPVEIKNPEMRTLQSKYLEELKALGTDITNTSFPYPFYLSRKLDLDEQQQKTSEQRSIRFDQFNGQTVLAVTGNYYAAYSADHLNKDQRARETFLSVVEPILKVVVPPFQTNAAVQGYAVEISHHIVGKVMGVSMERPENLMVFFPQNAALKLLAAKDETRRQAALLEAQLFVNAEPVTIWLNGEGPQVGLKAPAPDAPESAQPSNQAAVEVAGGTDGHATRDNIVPSFPKPTKPINDVPHPQPRDTSPEALASLQAANKQALETMVKELDPRVHFVSYAAPSFVAFRQNIYLELSLNTTLSEAAAGSRYRLAAMAFDDHIAPLIRPVLGYFKP